MIIVIANKTILKVYSPNSLFVFISYKNLKKFNLSFDRVCKTLHLYVEKGNIFR